MATEMDKEKREMEMAIARSMVDQQRLEVEKKSQDDLMEQQMKKLSLQNSSPTPGNLFSLDFVSTSSSLVQSDQKVMTGIICQKFKKKFLLGGEDSQSSSEDKEDGLVTATDVIKQEVKKMENRLSDQDLLKLKEANEAKWRSYNSVSFDKSIETFRTNTSEPLTESIMKMRSKPGSALIIKAQSRISCPSPLAKIDLEKKLEQVQGASRNEKEVKLGEEIIINDDKELLIPPIEEQILVSASKGS